MATPIITGIDGCSSLMGARDGRIRMMYVPRYRSQFPYGRKIKVNMNTINDYGNQERLTVELSVVKAYPHFVLFIDHRGVKHTYKYGELVIIGAAA